MIKAHRGMVTISGAEATVKAEFATIINSVVQSGMFRNDEEVREFFEKAFKILKRDEGRQYRHSTSEVIMKGIADAFSCFYAKTTEGTSDNEVCSDAPKITLVYGDKKVVTDVNHVNEAVERLIKNTSRKECK